MKVYEMIMEFELTVGLKNTNDYTNKVGVCYSITLEQTIPFIPDEAYLKKVENIIRENYEKGSVGVLECKFKGYKKFLEKEVES